MKGQIWISAVLYVLIAVAIMVLVMEAGIPIIKNLRDKGAFNRARDTMIAIDQQIEEIAGEGQGSQRVIPLDVNKGTVDVANQALRWKIETDSKIVEPKTKMEMGNLVVSADVDVSAASYATSYILENSYLLVNISKNGTESNWSAINTSRLINYITFKGTNTRTNGTFSFLINNSAASGVGTGYTKLLDSGNNLASATVLTHVNSTNFDYDLELTLDSKADFVKASLKNVVTK
jgi:hypothetical protein